MNIEIEKNQLPILSTNTEPCKYEINLKAIGYGYEIDSLYEKLEHLYNKEEMMNTKHWVKKENK